MLLSNKFGLAIILCAWCGCGWGEEPIELCLESLEIPQQCLVSSHCAYLQPRRIVIVTTNNRQDRLPEQDLFSKSLAKHLRQGQRFDVVIRREKMCRDKLPMRRGVFDEQELLELSGASNADAVLFCELEQISAYEPMQLQMSMLLVHVGEAVSLVSATTTVDLRDPSTQQAYVTVAGQNCDPFAVETHLNSPSLFIDFAAGLCANGLLSIW